MAKKSSKRAARPKKDTAGCMSGLISMFDFRQGRSTQRLLSDRNYTSRRHRGALQRDKFNVLSNLEEAHDDACDTEANIAGGDNSSKASIKALMAQDMSQAHTSKEIPSLTIELLTAELGLGDDLEKNHKGRQNKLVSTCDVNDSKDYQSTWSGSSENSCSDINLAKLMVEFCREFQKWQEKHIENNGDGMNDGLVESDDCQVSQKQYNIHKALNDVTEVLLTKNSVGAKLVSSHGDGQPVELMDVLDMLNSNKDNFLKLLQDPNSLLFKHFLDLQNTRTRENLLGSKPEESVSCQQSGHQFTSSMNKSLGDESSSQTSQRIVVLKPNMEIHEHLSNTTTPMSSPKSLHGMRNPEDNERVSSHFSLKELKRRLRNMIGDNNKDRDLITRDGILHKIPCGIQNQSENSKTLTSSQQTSKLSTIIRKGLNDSIFKQYWHQKKANKLTVAPSLYRESVSSEEAKKRLAVMLGSGGQNEVLSPTLVAKSLGRVNSLSEHSTPRSSPERDEEAESAAQLISSPLHEVKQDGSISPGSSAHSTGSSPCSDDKQDRPQLFNSTSTLPEPQLHDGEDLVQKADFGSEGTCIEEVPTEASDLEQLNEALPLAPADSVSINSITGQQLTARESTTENLDRPSPASVLEPLFFEDINCIGSPDDDVSTAEPQQLNLEECSNPQLEITSTVSEANLRIPMEEDREKVLKYVRTVLEASDVNYNQLLEKWQLANQLLDPSVFDEVGILSGQVISDPKLLFDCVNEVLVEIRDRYSSCTLWMSSIKPSIRPVPIGENFVQEVCKGVDRHLQAVSPYTLDWVIRKDLEEGNWMNGWLETEGAVVDITEVILDYIMEETILELYE